MFGLVVLASACARTGPPPGGPADTTAPELLSAAPESAAVGVDPGATLELIFSEKVDPNTVERALWITPAPGKLKVDVSGDRVSVRPEDGFPPDATIGILVTTALKDRMRERQQNRMETARRWTFATADSLDAGSVSGTVSRKGQRPESGQLLVALYPGDADTLPDPRETDPIAVTEADASDRFVLEGLPTDGKRRWLIALFDRDENRIIGGPGEFASALPETLVLTSRVQSRNVSLELIDPAAPASVRGALARAAGDSVSVWVELYAAAADSFASPVARIAAGPAGGFTLNGIPPGDYRLSAFCDANANRRRDDSEAAVRWGPLKLGAAESRDVGTWDFPACLPD